MHKIQKIVMALAIMFSACYAEMVIGQDEVDESSGLFTIEGRIYPTDMQIQNFQNREQGIVKNKWQVDTTISINSGEYKGFLREDGSFIVSGVPSGSYVVEIQNPDYFYEPVSVKSPKLFMSFIKLTQFFR